MTIKHVWKQPFIEYGCVWWWDNDKQDWFVGCLPSVGIPKWAWKE